MPSGDGPPGADAGGPLVRAPGGGAPVQKGSIDLGALPHLMPLDAGLLALLAGPGAEADLEFTLVWRGRSYPLAGVSVARSPTPVTRPTTRGGAYFSGRHAHRITGTVGDQGIVPSLSGAMLGPNAEFGDILIRAAPPAGGRGPALDLHANLTSSVQGPSGVELRMILVGIEQARGGAARAAGPPHEGDAGTAGESGPGTVGPGA